MSWEIHFYRAYGITCDFVRISFDVIFQKVQSTSNFKHWKSRFRSGAFFDFSKLFLPVRHMKHWSYKFTWKTSFVFSEIFSTNLPNFTEFQREIHCQALAKRSQHENATYRNIVGRNMLRAFGHRVATCWVLLAQIWKWSNLSQQHQTRRNTAQHGATHRNTVAKRTQHVAPNTAATCCVGMLRSFGRGFMFDFFVLMLTS